MIATRHRAVAHPTAPIRSLLDWPVSQEVMVPGSAASVAAAQGSAGGRLAAPAVGVLALQGDVAEHLRAVESAGGRGVPVRRLAELDSVDGLIIPGGESTAIWKLA